MTEAQAGNTVKVHYTGRFEDGTVFDSSEGRDPLEFTLGEGQVIDGFNDAVEGMSPGESKTTTIAPERGYGPRTDEMLIDVERDQFPDEIDPEIGMQLQVQGQGGQLIPVVVAEVGEESVTLDANHPLAGRELIFDIELVDIV